MKKIIFLALMGILTLQSVNAQRKGEKTRTPEQMVEKLDKKLNLTDEQEKQITTLYSDFFKQDLSRDAFPGKRGYRHRICIFRIHLRKPDSFVRCQGRCLAPSHHRQPHGCNQNIFQFSLHHLHTELYCGLTEPTVFQKSNTIREPGKYRQRFR